MIDPQQVKNTLQELKQKEDKQRAVDPFRHPALVFERLRAEAETRHRIHVSTTDPIVWEGAVDLVGTGIDTLLDVFLDIE